MALRTDTNLRAGLYARVSTEDRGQDPETQLRPLREYAERRGFIVVGEFVDHASGTTETRPRYQPGPRRRANGPAGRPSRRRHGARSPSCTAEGCRSDGSRKNSGSPTARHGTTPNGGAAGSFSAEISGPDSGSPALSVQLTPRGISRAVRFW